MGQGTTLGIPRGETAIAHHQRRFHAHNGSSPASFPRPPTPKALSPPSIARPRSEWGHDPFWARPPTPKALCHKARGCAVPGATPGSGRSAFPTPQGVVPFVPVGGAISTGGMGSCSRVRKKSPPVRRVPYPHNVQTPHTPSSILRHNRLRGCGAHPTHTRGNAADRVTPGFGAEPLRGSREGDHWTINYKRSRGVLRIETMGDPRERHVRHLPCATIYHVVYRNGWGGVLLKSNRYRRP